MGEILDFFFFFFFFLLSWPSCKQPLSKAALLRPRAAGQTKTVTHTPETPRENMLLCSEVLGRGTTVVLNVGEKKNLPFIFSFFSLVTLSQRERDSVGSSVLFRGLGKGALR